MIRGDGEYGSGHYLFWSDGFLRRLVEFFESLVVVAEIFLAADKDDG